MRLERVRNDHDHPRLLRLLLTTLTTRMTTRTSLHHPLMVSKKKKKKKIQAHRTTAVFPQLQPKEHGHNPGDDDWTIEGKHHHHDNITNKKNSNSIKHQEPRRPPNRKYEAVVTALKDDAVFVLQGRGWIENISSSNTINATTAASSGMVEIHGHPLLASQWYKFAMTSWSSCWITVHLRNSQRARMRILSHNDEDSGSCSFAVHNKTVRPTVLPRSDGKRPSMPSSKTTTTTGESTTMKSHSTIMLTLPFFKTHRSMTAITTVLLVSNNNN